MNFKNIGFIGLGQMGGGMALNLLRATGALSVHDPSPAAVEPLAQAGAKVFDSPASMASECDLILLCLPYSPQVDTVMFGEQGLLSGNTGNLTVIDTSTLDRQHAIEFSERAAEANITYCDCPVSGLPARAQSGTLAVMFGGDRNTFDTTEKLLSSFGESVIYCGDIGCGQAMKAVNNIIYNINIAALCEVLPMAVAAGLDPEELAKLVTSGSSRSFASGHFVPKMMAGEFSNDFKMGDAYKDIVNMQRIGIETGAAMPVTNAMINTYQSAMAAGYKDEPKSAMLKVYEQVLGVRFRDKNASN